MLRIRLLWRSVTELLTRSRQGDYHGAL